MNVNDEFDFNMYSCYNNSLDIERIMMKKIIVWLWLLGLSITCLADDSCVSWVDLSTTYSSDSIIDYSTIKIEIEPNVFKPIKQVFINSNKELVVVSEKMMSNAKTSSKYTLSNVTEDKVSDTQKYMKALLPMKYKEKLFKGTLITLCTTIVMNN